MWAKKLEPIRWGIARVVAAYVALAAIACLALAVAANGRPAVEPSGHRAMSANGTPAVERSAHHVMTSQGSRPKRTFKPVSVNAQGIAFRVTGVSPSAVIWAYVLVPVRGSRPAIVPIAVSKVTRALRLHTTLWIFAGRVLARRRLKAVTYRRRLWAVRLVLVLRSRRAGGSSSAIAQSPACGAVTRFRVGLWPPPCWRPYGESSPFNQALPANPRIYATSAAVVARTLGFGTVRDLRAGIADTSSDYEHPSYYSQPTDPLYTVKCTDYNTRCPISGMQIRIPSAARAAGGSDGHMAVIDQAGGWEYDFWQVQSKPPSGGVIAASWGGRTRLDGDGLGSGATAAHFGLQAGIIRAQEMESGQIKHALFMTVNCTSGSPVYPAQANASVCANPIGAPSTGARFQLNYSDAEINALPVPLWKKTILRALAHYGAFVGDTGGTGFGFQFESGSTYTSFGYSDAMVSFAQTQPGVTSSGGIYDFDLASGVDWTRLRMIDPCVSQHTC
jgi:hypothetical protein